MLIEKNAGWKTGPSEKEDQVKNWLSEKMGRVNKCTEWKNSVSQITCTTCTNCTICTVCTNCTITRSSFTQPTFSLGSLFNSTHIFIQPTFSFSPLFYLLHFFTRPTFSLRPLLESASLFLTLTSLIPLLHSAFFSWPTFSISTTFLSQLNYFTHDHCLTFLLRINLNI